MAKIKVGIVVNLPNSALITDPEKTAYMISISSKGICGEEDFRFLEWKKAFTSARGARQSFIQRK
jgi:hypothetical protein